jgi:hypothetical protein
MKNSNILKNNSIDLIQKSFQLDVNYNDVMKNLRQELHRVNLDDEDDY